MKTINLMSLRELFRADSSDNFREFVRDLEISGELGLDDVQELNFDVHTIEEIERNDC